MATIGTPIRRREDYRFLTGGGHPLQGAGEVRVRDAATGQPIGPPLPHIEPVLGVAWSPDGSLLLTACRDKQARLWDAATSKPIGELMKLGMPGASSAQFSPDGRRILTVPSRNPLAQVWEARVWDAMTGKAIGQPMKLEGGVNSAQFSFALTPGLLGLTYLNGNFDGSDGLDASPAALALGFVQDFAPATSDATLPASPPPMTWMGCIAPVDIGIAPQVNRGKSGTDHRRKKQNARRGGGRFRRRSGELRQPCGRCPRQSGRCRRGRCRYRPIRGLRGY